MKKFLLAAALVAAAPGSYALNLVDHQGQTLDLNLESTLGAFDSEEDYVVGGGKTWYEGYVKATLAAQQPLTSGTLYGAAGLVSSMTRGDGDAGGYSSGDESRSSLDSAYLGWKSREAQLDLSVGKQMFTLGDGFLIAGDAVNAGDGLDQTYGVDINRGGAYYLAARKSFANSAIVRFDPEGPLRGDLFWLRSDNAFQQNTRLGGVNLEWVEDAGTVAGSVIQVLGVDAGKGLGIWDQRDGMQIVSLRGQGNAGIKNLLLAAEYAKESGGDTAVHNDANGWYMEGGWTFADVRWTPAVSGRYARFSADDADTADNEAFDPLFFGFSRGFGTWFQGEVAANYAGPANSGNDVKRLELTLAPSESLLLGLQSWNFRSLTDSSDLAGRELDIYGLWTLSDHLVISPLLGFYTPVGTDVKANQGNASTNTYAQLLVMLNY